MDPNRLSKTVIDLVSLVDRLRGPGGCPWDAQQTDATIKMYLLEEAYEVLESVEKGTPSEVCGELGDLLFQILFLTKLAEERKEFDFVDVVEKITGKMIRRHPHVFGHAQVEGPEEVARNWARIKEEEQGKRGENVPHINSIPLSLPALLRTHRMLERVGRGGSNQEASKDMWDKVEKGFDSLRDAYEKGQQEVGDSLGRLLFVLAEFAGVTGFNAEELLRRTNQRFAEKMESDSNHRQGGVPER